MTPFTQELSDLILTALSTAPRSQIDPRLLVDLPLYRGETTGDGRGCKNLREQYDFLVSLSKSAGVSSFVVALCAMDQFYEPPEPGPFCVDGHPRFVSGCWSCDPK